MYTVLLCEPLQYLSCLVWHNTFLWSITVDKLQQILPNINFSLSSNGKSNCSKSDGML